MSQDDLKRNAAAAANGFYQAAWNHRVGTGSTVNHFIDLLATVKIDRGHCLQFRSFHGKTEVAWHSGSGSQCNR